MTMKYTYRTMGTCSSQIDFEVEDGILIPYSSGTVTVKAKVHGMVWKCKVVITDSTEDDWNDDLDDDSDDDSENADDGYMDDEVNAAA